MDCVGRALSWWSACAGYIPHPTYLTPDLGLSPSAYTCQSPESGFLRLMMRSTRKLRPSLVRRIVWVCQGAKTIGQCLVRNLTRRSAHRQRDREGLTVTYTHARFVYKIRQVYTIQRFYTVSRVFLSHGK